MLLINDYWEIDSGEILFRLTTAENTTHFLENELQTRQHRMTIK